MWNGWDHDISQLQSWKDITTSDFTVTSVCVKPKTQKSLILSPASKAEVDDDINGECLPAGNAETSADDKNSSILLNDDQAEVVENVDGNCTEEVEVDQDELERDKIIEEVIVSSVTKPIEKEKICWTGNYQEVWWNWHCSERNEDI